MSTPDPMLQKAIQAHQAGRVAQARAMYERILRRRPRDPDALNFLGMLHFHQGDYARGMQLLQRSLQSAPGNPHALMNYANMQLVVGDTEAAAETFRQVTEIAPAMWQAWFNRATCAKRLGRVDETLESFRRTISLKPDHDTAYERLGMALYRLGRTDEMAALYAQWLQVNPDNPTARHMHAAAVQQSVPDRASDEFVRVTFDKFASSFDESLQGLNYRAPQLVAEALERQCGPGGGGPRVDVLDAGAGTGLCGPLLRSRARRLVAVDLSPGMLDKARERNVYDELVEMELCSFMRSRPASFDIVVSADTLCYFGALEEAMAAAAETLRPGGALAFTLERLDADAAEARFRIGPHGRYMHAEPYVRSVLVGHGLEPVEFTGCVLRSELAVDVPGMLVVALRPR